MLRGFVIVDVISCEGHPITWLIPTWISSLVSEEKEPLPALNEGYSDSQVHVDNESEDPDYKPPLDLNGLDDTTPRHAYNLRPRRCKFTNPSSQIACFVLSSLALICYCFLC